MSRAQDRAHADALAEARGIAADAECEWYIARDVMRDNPSIANTIAAFLAVGVCAAAQDQVDAIGASWVD